MKALSALLVATSLMSLNAFAQSKCKAGGIDALAQATHGIYNGSQSVYVEAGTPVYFLEVPGGLRPNYRVIVLDPKEKVLLGTTMTSFKECNVRTCQPQSVATLASAASGIRYGSELINLPAGSQVYLLNTPAHGAINFEGIPMEVSESLLLGASTRFRDCR